MHLRHIRPRSVEWYDALETEGRAGAVARLLPEEATRLRALREMEVGLEQDSAPRRDRARTRYDS